MGRFLHVEARLHSGRQENMKKLTTNTLLILPLLFAVSCGDSETADADGMDTDTETDTDGEDGESGDGESGNSSGGEEGGQEG